jgi:hypothetical protein
VPCSLDVGTRSLGPAATSGDFIGTATPTAKLTVAIDTLVDPTTVGMDVIGPMDHFDPNRTYSWPAAHWAGTYAGPTDVAALNAATSFDTSGFLNPVAGTFGWGLDSADRKLSLVYTPTAVPEPGTLALVGLVAARLSSWRRRGQPTSRAHHGLAQAWRLALPIGPNGRRFSPGERPSRPRRRTSCPTTGPTRPR